MYDIFYLDDPGEDFEWVAKKLVKTGQQGNVANQGFVFHCLVTDNQLGSGIPHGSLTFLDLPIWAKNYDGTSKHSFAGRQEVLEKSNGGFDVEIP